ncbi:alpha/beta-hydrolase, partial [Trichodelitschia bisporula]
CKPVTILFGRGTTESGIPDALGGTVGPALRTQATKKGWAIEGIKYDASLAGIYCLGMPGGVACIDQLSKLVQRCPNTKVILSGYSQGAMVARICAAWSKEPAQKQIAGLALFGDPFNGAAVKGVPKENVKTWCTSGDGVCKGDFSISAAHLAY